MGSQSTGVCEGTRLPTKRLDLEVQGLGVWGFIGFKGVGFRVQGGFGHCAVQKSKLEVPGSKWSVNAAANAMQTATLQKTRIDSGIKETLVGLSHLSFRCRVVKRPSSPQELICYLGSKYFY